jgi:hypothetical protein
VGLGTSESVLIGSSGSAFLGEEVSICALTIVNEKSTAQAENNISQEIV